MRRRGRAGTALVVCTLSAAVAVSGCSWRGLNSLPLPGTQGTGHGSYQVRIQMPNVTTLSQNSPVLVDDVTVGSVSGIDVQDWHALVTVSLNPGVHLPANATARIGQTSLLGSTHVELAPPTDTKPAGTLRGGDTIPLDRAGVYPTTEETLSAVSVVLNGGGFAALGDISRELDTALTGRADAVHDLIDRLDALTTGLDAQRGQIVAALDGLDRIGTQFARQKDTVAAALDRVPPALRVLVDQRKNLTDALVALGNLSDVAGRIIDTQGEDLQANLRNLGPVLKSLADTGNNLTEVLTFLPTFPFPMRTYQKAVRGDYLNLFMTLDLTPKRIDTDFLTGTGLGGALGGAQSKIGQPPGVAGQATDPFRAPLGLPPPPAPKSGGAR